MVHHEINYILTLVSSTIKFILHWYLTYLKSQTCFPISFIQVLHSCDPCIIYVNASACIYLNNLFSMLFLFAFCFFALIDKRTLIIVEDIFQYDNYICIGDTWFLEPLELGTFSRKLITMVIEIISPSHFLNHI